MRKFVTFLMALVMGSSFAYVNAECSEVRFEAGYRRDNLTWRFIAPSCDPFFENSNRFKDLDIFEVALYGETFLGCNWYGRAYAGAGWILDGDVEQRIKIFDSLSYFSDEDIALTNRDRNIIDGRWVADLDIAIGYPFYFCDCTASLAPVVGYGFNEQNIRIEDDVVFSNISGFLLPGSGRCCDTKFISRWFGPYVGVDFKFSAYDCLRLWAQLEYHWLQFNGRQQSHFDVSLLDNFHKQTRDADGWAFKAGIEYDLCNCWTIGLSSYWRDYRASRRHRACASDFSDFLGLRGISSSDRVFSNDAFKTRHSWRTYSFNVTLGYLF